MYVPYWLLIIVFIITLLYVSITIYQMDYEANCINMVAGTDTCMRV